jgi:hypothetical protein
MPTLGSMAIHAAQPYPWVAPERRSAALKASGGGLVHTYESDAQALGAAAWVYLQAVIYAEQIHPATADDLDAMSGRDLARWSIEGPTFVRPGETPNCTLKLEVAYSLTATPGSDWREFRPGRYKLRSYQMKLTVTRPTTDYDFRIYRLGAEVLLCSGE